jgi:hypothetical protein
VAAVPSAEGRHDDDAPRPARRLRPRRGALPADRRGLESDKIDTAQSEALALTAQAQATWDASTATSVDALDLAAFDIMRRILTAPGSNPSRYVVMSRSVANDSDISLRRCAVEPSTSPR